LHVLVTLRCETPAFYPLGDLQPKLYFNYILMINTVSETETF